MQSFEFLGDYETDAGLPDGSVVRVKPGEVVEFDGDLTTDSSHWASTSKSVTATPTEAPAPTRVVLDPADDPENSAPPLNLPNNLTPSHIVEEPIAAPEAPAAPTTAPDSTSSTPA